MKLKSPKKADVWEFTLKLKHPEEYTRTAPVFSIEKGLSPETYADRIERRLEEIRKKPKKKPKKKEKAKPKKKKRGKEITGEGKVKKIAFKRHKEKRHGKRLLETFLRMT